MLSSRSLLKGLAVTSAAIVFTVAGGSAALADDISNNLDTSVDAVAEVMTLNVGGSSGTTRMYVVQRNSDGKNGCNLTGSTTLGVTVSSSNTSVATVSPSSLTFGTCNDSKLVTVTPVAEGSAIVSLAQTSNTTDGSFSLVPATFTVDVAPPANTAPTVTIIGVSGGARYEKGSVPSAVCSVSDAEDGPSTSDATLSAVTGPLAAYGLGNQNASCSYTDDGGLTASSSVTYAIVDTTAPTLSLPGNLIEEASGPLGAVVGFTATATDSGGPAHPDVTCSPASGATFAVGTTTVNCSATDLSGNTASGSFTVTVQDTIAPEVSVPADITAEATGPSGAPVNFTATASDLVTPNLTPSCTPAPGSTFPLTTTTVTCTATDEAGNTGSSSFAVTVQDTTAPDVTVPENKTIEATGPSGAIVTFDASATDAVGPLQPEVTCIPASGSTFALGTHTVTCTASDDYNNRGTASFTVTVQDTTPPLITWLGGPQAGGVYYFGSVPAAPTCTATDLVDTDVACSVTGYSSAVGDHTLTATATDDSQNSLTETRKYSVLAWTPKGFYSPVDMNGVWNTVKGGSTVPLKFEVFAGPTELTATSTVQGFTVKGTACPSSTVVADDIELTTTGGTSLRYDSTAGQFVQNWQTPKLPGACYKVTVTTQDGSFLTANFKLK